MRYQLTMVSRNTKTGPIPVSTSSRDTCPTSCPLIGKGGCYAENGPLRLHWNNVDLGKTGVDFSDFLRMVKAMPRGQLWRYGQAGDLPGIGDEIDAVKLQQLARANVGKRVISFTHKPATLGNLSAITEAQKLGFHVNLSANNIREADALADLGLSVVAVLPSEYARKSRGGSFTETLTEYRNRTKGLVRITSEGRRIAVCPATYTKTRCSECQVCASPRKAGTIIGFPAHGTKKRALTINIQRAHV